MVRLWTLPLWGLLPVLSRGEDVDGKPAVVRRQSDAPGPDAYRLRAHQRLAVLGDYLYVVGGEVSQLIDREMDPRVMRPVNSTLSLPLNEEWTNSSASFKIIDNGAYPSIKNPGLWIDAERDRLYSWGGEGPFLNGEVAEERELWVFEADGEGGGSWTTKDPDSRDDLLDTTQTTEGGCATCGTTGYCLGGLVNQWTDKKTGDGKNEGPLVKQLVSLDMETMKWETGDSEPFNPPYESFFAGEAVCGSAGDADPTLLFLGGEVFEDSIGTLSTEWDAEQLQFFNLTWLDPVSGRWHWQKTAGDAPSSRSNFCATGIRSSEGTYDVFVYGGHRRYAGQFESLSDVYVLSMPAFRWFRVANGTPRSLLDCAATESGQVIVVGGFQYSEIGGWWAKEDPWPQGLGVFDMNSMEWSDRYDPEAGPYSVPETIREWYDNGGLEEVEWSSEDVEAMFADFQLGSSDSGDSGGSGGSGSSGDGSNGNKKNIGAIVGGTVGGVAAVAIAGALVWFLRRRKRGGAMPVPTSEEAVSESEKGGVPEMDSPNMPQEVEAGKSAHEMEGNGYFAAQELEASLPGAREKA